MIRGNFFRPFQLKPKVHVTLERFIQKPNTYFYEPDDREKHYSKRNYFLIRNTKARVCFNSKQYLRIYKIIYAANNELATETRAIYVKTKLEEELEQTFSRRVM